MQQMLPVCFAFPLNDTPINCIIVHYSEEEKKKIINLFHIDQV